MGEQIIRTKNEAVERWQQRMPRFFRRIVYLCAIVATTAFAANQVMQIGGAEPHQWWHDIYPSLLAVPVGMIVVCKLTVAGGYKDIDLDKLSGGHVDQTGPSHSTNMSDVDPIQPGDTEIPQ